MLLLTRKPGEAIHLFDQSGEIIATISLNNSSRSQVRLAIDAKDDIKVLRSELHDAADGPSKDMEQPLRT